MSSNTQQIIAAGQNLEVSSSTHFRDVKIKAELDSGTLQITLSAPEFASATPLAGQPPLAATLSFRLQKDVALKLADQIKTYTERLI